MCTAQPLASQAILKSGSSAIDAALAAAPVLAIAEPAASHLGGVVLIDFRSGEERRAYALNGSDEGGHKVRVSTVGPGIMSRKGANPRVGWSLSGIGAVR